jgi:hypothetical protein
MRTYETNKEEQQEQLIKKPKMLPLPNGSYYLINDIEPKVVENLQDLKRESPSTVRGAEHFVDVVLQTTSRFAMVCI